jgi:NADPH-dependent curcumin reductase CurA
MLLDSSQERDYKAGPIHGRLNSVAPDEIDVYIDNVGGEFLKDRLALMQQ